MLIKMPARFHFVAWKNARQSLAIFRLHLLAFPPFSVLAILTAVEVFGQLHSRQLSALGHRTMVNG